MRAEPAPDEPATSGGAVGLFLPPAAEAPSDSPPPGASTSGSFITARLRIEWGGGTAQSYAGSIRIDGGSLAEPTPLGLELDEPGSMFVVDRKLQIAAGVPRGYDGVDVTVTAPPNAKLLFDVHPTSEEQRAAKSPPTEVALAEVLRTTHHSTLAGQSGNRLSIRRAPGNRLQVKLARDVLIFSSGEKFDLEVRPHLLGLAAATELRLTAALLPARQTKALWSDDTSLTAPADDAAWPSVPLSLRLPEEEGVYDLVLELSQRSLGSRLPWSAPIERRKVQFVVLSPRPPGRPVLGEAPEPTLLEEIDPASPGWWERVRSAAVPHAMRRGPLGNCRVSARRTPAGLFLELPPSSTVATSDAPGELAWQAYPLAVSQPGKPHYVEIDYPSDVAQSLGVSLVEPNAAGAVLPLGVDQGFFIDDTQVEATPRRLTRRFVVWPKSTSPLVVVMNRRGDAPAVYGKIRLLGPKGAALREFVALPWNARNSTSLPQARLPEARADGRLLAAYFDRPLFCENFSNDSAVDDALGEQTRSLDDWVTYYEGASRLVEYLGHAGYNGAIVTVAADGGTIYPSKLLEPTPRYDDGVYFSTAQDPVRKDVLELLLRMFDREGLRLVPALQLTAKLPGLEAERRMAAARGAADPVAPTRTTFRTSVGAEPAYDLLRPRVRQELTSIVAELAERYGAHPSLVGTAVHLSVDGFTQLPGLDWGSDYASLRSFAEQSQITLPPNLSERELASWVLDTHRAAWLAWRAQAVADFYGELREVAAGPDAARPLYLISAHSWDRPDLEDRLKPSLPQTPTAEQTLLESGIDPVRLGKQPGVVWLRPYRGSASESLARRGAALEIQRAEGFDAAAAAQPLPAGLIFHEPAATRLESFERQSPFQPTSAQFVAANSASGVAARRLFVRQLAQLDSLAVVQGGWTLPLGHEDEIRKIAGVVRSLPAEKFATVGGTPGYVRVRTLSRDDRTYLYVVNDAPWPTTVSLDISAASNVAWRGFTGSAPQAGFIDDGGRRRWQARLEPYDVVGGVFLQPDVEAANPEIVVGPEVAAMLAERIKRLWSSATELNRTSRSIAPADAGFEGPVAAKDAQEGAWRHAGDFRTSADRPHDGAQCGVLASTKNSAYVVSEPIQLGTTGRAALSVWLRAGDAPAPALRLALVGLPRAGSSAQGFFRYATVGADSSTALGPEWRQFVFQVHDLPMQDIAAVQIRFETSAPGEVYLDDVRVVDVDFTEAERLQLSKMITLAEYKLERNELGDCARLLDGYWPRFLATHLPAAATPTANASSGGPILTAGRDAPPATMPADPNAPESPAGMRDRLRRVLPSFMR